MQNTPLHAAASKGHQKIVKLLVKHGANVQHKFGFRKVSCVQLLQVSLFEVARVLAYTV